MVEKCLPRNFFYKNKKKTKKKCQNEVFQGHKKMLATIWGEFIFKKQLNFTKGSELCGALICSIPMSLSSSLVAIKTKSL